MKHDFIFYEFSKPKIESKDISHFLGVYGKPKLPVGHTLRRMMGTMAFCVHGYDDDPRELPTIPEVRSFYRAFGEAWPYWFYFCDLHQDSLRLMTLCCLPSITAMKFDHNPVCAVELNLEELSDFIEIKLRALNQMCQWAGMREEDVLKRTIEVFAYYGLPFSSPK